MQLTAEVIPGFLLQDGQTLTEAILRAMATPTVNIVGAVSSLAIADGAVNENKLSGTVAGDGLAGGAGVKLKVVPDGSSLEINGSAQVGIKAAGVLLEHLGFGAFFGCSAYNAGIHGLVPEPKAGQGGYCLTGDGKFTDVAAAVTASVAAKTQFNIFMARTFC